MIQILLFDDPGIEDFFYLLVISGDFRQVAIVLKYHSDLGEPHIWGTSHTFNDCCQVRCNFYSCQTINPAATKPNNK